jgi:hypothetical protein
MQNVRSKKWSMNRKIGKARAHGLEQVSARQSRNAKERYIVMMAKATKTLLALALAGLGTGFLFITGLVNVQGAAWLYVALPAGAICFGLFLIALMLEKETARFDQEHHAAPAIVEGGAATAAQSADKSCCASKHVHEESYVSANAS